MESNSFLKKPNRAALRDKPQTYKLFGYDWTYNMEGGRCIHPDFPNSYYSDASVNIFANQLVELSIRKIPTTIKHWDGEIYNPVYAAGAMRSVNSFTYGEFSADIEMPKGGNLWPSFWLSGTHSWPPEIDIVEGYTNNRGNYLRGFNWRLESNVHYDTEYTTHNQIGPRGTSWFKLLKDPRNNLIQYKLIWTPKEIRIFIDGKLQRIITDKIVLDNINKSPWMNVIFQMGVPKNYNDSNLNSLEQPMIIRNFRYKPL